MAPFLCLAISHIKIPWLDISLPFSTSTFSIPYFAGRFKSMITSASCSIDPDSRKSDIIGLLSCLDSSARFNCDKAITGMFNSVAKFFNARLIPDISCSLFCDFGTAHELQVIQYQQVYFPSFLQLAAHRF